MGIFILGAIIGIILSNSLAVIIYEMRQKDGFVENITGYKYNVIGNTTLKDGSKVKVLQSTKDAHIECVDSETLKANFHEFRK